MNIEEISPPNDPGLYRIRHSCAHLLAQAVRDYLADDGAAPVHFAIGPPIENGFYYDFELPRPLTDKELPLIEERMRAFIGADLTFVKRVVSREEAQALFAEQPFKLELIDDIDGELSVYTQSPADFTDLCRGPHVESSSAIAADAFRLTSVSGAYWRGDEKRAHLQRIYGTAWRTSEELERYLWQLAEAERRDHRRLGKELELFHFDPTAPGMPYWLPKGLKILNELIAFWRHEHEERGYLEIASPMLNRKELWVTSGHWDHYQDSMFLSPVDANTTYLVKPMNCPNAMIVFNLKLRSYKELPLRLSDCDVLHRNERSGSLHGLFRVQKFQQDDAHIFLRPDQLADEFDRILDLADHFYRIFGLKYTYRLGTRPADFMGDVESWDEAEATLRRVLDKNVGPDLYLIAEGDGAFYGPKIDILMEDGLGRRWQMGTLQLDFQIPRRFGCSYADQYGQAQTPVVIHRVIYGSLERFIGILIEHTAGALPVWLSPVQARVISISEKHAGYARIVRDHLHAAGIRVELDDGDTRMQARIRQAEVDKVPYIAVVGNREMTDDTVSLRLRSRKNLGSVSVPALIDQIKEAITSKAL